MNSTIYIQIISIFYCILLSIIYFSRERLNNIENKLYKTLVLVNLIGLVIDIICAITTFKMTEASILNILLTKFYLMYFVTWMVVFTIYIITISISKNNFKNEAGYNSFISRLFNVNIVLYIIYFIVVLALPLDFSKTPKGMYAYGMSINFVYIIVSLNIIVCIICMIKNVKKLKSKKYIPLFSFMSIGVIVMIIQKLNPTIVLIPATETFITFLMYFTIENPDIKVLNELYRNRELMEQNYEDKYNFLFEITQEARNPLIRISTICNEMERENDKDKIKLGSSAINNLVRELDFSINSILNISSLDVQKLRLVDSKYDLNKVCSDLVVRVKPNVSENVEFRYNFPQVTPTFYGDYMKLRQILYSLLINSTKYTSNGYIDFSVNLIEKYDVCRIIFTITDSGTGMTLDKVNELLSATGELNKQEMIDLDKKEYNIKLCQKVIKIMGGSLIIKSDFGKGTSIKLIIDQRVYHDKEDSLLNRYENIVNNYKKVLIVSQDNRLIKAIKHKCNENSIAYVNLLYGMDAIDRIKAGKHYDFILISDEMREMSGLMTLKGMKEIDKFNVPVIIMLNKDKANIKEHYLDDGFSDYLLTSDFDNEMDRIINRY